MSTSPQTVGLSGTGSLSGLLSILVDPGNPILAVGGAQRFFAIGRWPGGVLANISYFVTWSSSAPSVAPVNSTGMAQAITEGTATITASSGPVSGATTVAIAPPALTSIAVAPPNPSVPVGSNEQFTALLSYSDGSTKDTTSSVTWASSAAAVATVTSSGLVSPLAQGSTTITATSGSVTGSTTLTVSQPQCVTPPAGMIGWWTGDGNAVDIAGNNSGQLQSGATYGTGEVGQAFSFGGSGASVLVNSPVYSPTAGTLMFWFMPTGAGSLTGSYDGTNRTPGLAVDASGGLTWEFGDLSAQSLGPVSLNQWSHVVLTYSTANSEVTISVYLNGNLAASAIASPLSSWYPQVAFGAYLGGQQPSFNGSMDELAVFSQALSAQQIQQIYNAFSAGMCKPSLQSIAVTPLNPSLAVGLSQQFDAVGNYSDGTIHDLTSSATWGSSNPVVTTVNGSGQATAAAIGSATITAALGGQTGSSNLSVVPSLVSIQVNPPNPSIAAGTTQAFTATGTFSDGLTQDLTTSVNWSSSLPSSATISSGGLVNGVVAGQATIAASAGAVSGSTLLTVTNATLSTIIVAPANPTVAAGTTQAFSAMGTFNDGSTQDVTTSVNWSSSLPSSANISSVGLVNGMAAGQSTIAASAGAVSGSTLLTVTNATLSTIIVAPANPTIAAGTGQAFTAMGTFSDGSTQDVTTSVSWSSSLPSIASTSSGGLTNGIAAGQSTIAASAGSVSGSTLLTVTNATLSTIIVAPANPTIAAGTTRPFIATGVFSDGSLEDLTASVSWVCLTPSVATINTGGLATGLAAGLTTVTASSGSVNNSAMLTVTAAVLNSVAVSPVNPSLFVGNTQQFTATGTYSDNGTVDLTGIAVWSSSDSNVAPLSAAGLASGLMTGTVIISASFQSLSGSTALTVSTPLLPAITTQPVGQLISSGHTATLTAGVSGALPLSYQWYSGLSGDTANPVSGATSSLYTTSALTVNTSYWVQVSNSLGLVNSNTATVVIAGPRHADVLLFPVLTRSDPNFTDFMANILPNLWGVSVEMKWNAIETSPGVYDFSTFDASLQPFIQAGKAVNLIIWPATEGGDNTPPIGSTPIYIFTQAWANAVGAASPQDMVVCGSYMGDSSNPFYVQAITRGGGMWNTSISSDTSGLPVSYEAPFRVGFQNFIQAVIAHYNGNPTTPIGYIRFGLSQGGEASPLCNRYWPGPDGTGSYSKAEYLSYVQTMTTFVAQQNPRMTILADLHATGSPPDLSYADSEAVYAVANQQGMGTNGLQKSDITNFNLGQPCDADWCALFIQYGATSYNAGPITLSLQTLGWSDPTGQAQSGSLVDLLPFIEQHGVNNLELWLADAALAFSPNYCKYPNAQCNSPDYNQQQYISAYQQAIQAFESK